MVPPSWPITKRSLLDRDRLWQLARIKAAHTSAVADLKRLPRRNSAVPTDWACRHLVARLGKLTIPTRANACPS